MKRRQNKPLTTNYKVAAYIRCGGVVNDLPVLWRCWLGGRNGIRPVKNWVVGCWRGCLERGADLHMAQLMPLPLTVSCFSKIQIGFAFLVLAHLGSPGKMAVKRVCVCVCGHPVKLHCIDRVHNSACCYWRSVVCGLDGRNGDSIGHIIEANSSVFFCLIWIH